MGPQFDHLRTDDGEHVGYIEIADDLFIPYDRLWNRRGEPMELAQAEALLDEIGLSLLAEDWVLSPEESAEAPPTRVRIVELTRDTVTVAPTLDGATGSIAKSLDLTTRTTLPLPASRLRPA